ncbi:MAG: right-handed parallel beta-helix repeat-containing protein [Planctomycetaceae bacterium]|nr:right-handed parallel beta-helix repeat-containing protein [Planctomycetaceae bacterium]
MKTMHRFAGLQTLKNWIYSLTHQSTPRARKTFKRWQRFEPLESRYVLSTFYVDDNFTNPVVGQDPDGAGPATNFGTDSFATIQAGINASATSGDTVQVNSGTYAESLVVTNKSVTLLGAQANIDARGRVVGAPNPAVETVVAPVSGRALALQSVSGTVTVNGFSFVGNVSGSVGVIESTAGTTNGLQLLNNHIAVATGGTGAAINLNQSASDVTIHQNAIFSASGSATAVTLGSSAQFHGLHVTDNNVVHVGTATGTGLTVDGNRNVGTSVTLRTPLIDGNLFQNFAVGLNVGARAVANAQIVENTFTGNVGGMFGGTLNTTIARNTFSSNSEYGVRLSSQGNNADASFGAQSTTVSNNVFVNNGTTVNLVTGYGDIVIDDQFNGTQSTNIITNNSLSSTIAIYNSETNAETINASGNWFGTTVEASVLAKIIGTASANVDVNPYLGVGTDTDLVTAGFQGNVAALFATTLGAQAGVSTRTQEAINSLAASGTVTANAGTYSGNVTGAGKALTLAIGSGPAQVTVNGNVTLDANDALAMQINGNVAGTSYDQLVVNGAVALGTAALNTSLGFSPAAGASFTLIANDGADVVGSNFLNLSQGTGVVLGSDKLYAYYSGALAGDGNDVTLQANVAPTTTGLADVNVSEDAVDTVINLNAAFADQEDLDGALTYTVTGNTNLGLFTSVTANSSTGQLTLNYAPDLNSTANGGPATITVRATDTGGDFVETSFQVTVSAVNDAPVATITPTVLATLQGVDLNLKNVGLSVSDVDAGAGTVRATLSVTTGTLNVAAGTSGATVSGSGTASVQITGTVAQVNALLNTNATSSLAITGLNSLTTGQTLTLSVNDQGNTGTGGALTASDTATFNVQLVPNVSLSISPSPLQENGGVAQVTASLDTTSSVNVVVNLSLSGSASTGVDYSASSTSVVIPAGSLSAAISLTAIEDSLSEGAESVVIDISTVTGGLENGTQQVTTYIGSVLANTVATNVTGNILDTDRYSINGSVLTIHGTASADTIYVIRHLTNGFYTYFDGELLVFDTGTINQVVVQAAGGKDIFSYQGNASITENVTMNPASFAVTAAGLTVQADGEVQYIYGQAADSATMSDVGGDDVYYMRSEYGYLFDRANTYLSEPIGFGTITANASTGTDIVIALGNSGVDNVNMTATQTSIVTGGATYIANNFEQQVARGNGGDDTATLNGTAGNDVYTRQLSAAARNSQNTSILVMPNSFEQVFDFATVNVVSGDGTDIAVLRDSAGNDTLTGNPTSTTLQTSYSLETITGFSRVYAFASTGTDTSTLVGSSDNDVLYGDPNRVLLYSGSNYLLEARAFDSVFANLAGSASGGTDVAILDDGAGNDTLVADDAFALLTYQGGASLRVNAFDSVFARGNGGGTNSRTVTNPLDYNLVFSGNWA